MQQLQTIILSLCSRLTTGNIVIDALLMAFVGMLASAATVYVPKLYTRLSTEYGRGFSCHRRRARTFAMQLSMELIPDTSSHTSTIGFQAANRLVIYGILNELAQTGALKNCRSVDAVLHPREVAFTQEKLPSPRSRRTWR